MEIDPFYSRNSQWQTKLWELKSYSESDHSILLMGPSGCGKDVLARKIHQLSPRALFPMISVNCAAIQESLVESELFGHKKGSFTGAQSDRKGAFSSANNGTLFLDEIGDLSLNIQAKLLRCLENGKIKAVGDDQERDVNVRIIAATHKPIAELVEQKEFRMDLYYRLNVIQVQVPSLSQRPEDIAALVKYFGNQHGLSFTPQALEILVHHNWPGNIRELRNFVMKAACLNQKSAITAEQVGRMLISQKIELPEIKQSRLTREMIRQIERSLLLERLVANDWNQRQTAKDLGMPKSTLHDQLRRFKIQKPSDVLPCD